VILLAAPQCPLAIQALRRLADNISNRLNEGGVVGGKLTRLPGVSADYAVGPVVPANRNANSGLNAPLNRVSNAPETRLVLIVADDDRLIMRQRVTGSQII